MRIMKKGELERLRLAAGLTVQQLAARSNVNRRTIERIESGQQPRVKDRTTEDLARGLRCEADVLSTLEGQPPEWTRTPAPMVSPAHSVARTSPDTKQAQREASMGIDRPTIEVAGKDIPIMSYMRKKQCELLYATLTNDTFAACGQVRDYKAMPSEVASLLNADVGAGASYFVIQREIKRLGPQGGSEHLRTVVYVPAEKHCRELMEHHSRREEVAVFMRIVVREPSADWKGFPTFDPEAAFRPWAFVSQWIARRGEFVEKNVEPRDQ